MLVSLSDGICRIEEMHMKTQLSLILLIQHFKVNVRYFIWYFSSKCWSNVRKMLNTLNKHWLKTWKLLFISIPSDKFVVKNRWYFRKFINLNTWFSIAAFCQATLTDNYQFVYLKFEAFANRFTCLKCIIERGTFRPTVFINVESRPWKKYEKGNDTANILCI